MVTEKAKEPVWKQKGLKGPAWKELGYKKPGRVQKYAEKNEAHTVYNKKMPAKRVTPEEADLIDWLREEGLIPSQVKERLQKPEKKPKQVKKTTPIKQQKEPQKLSEDMLSVLNLMKKGEPMDLIRISYSQAKDNIPQETIENILSKLKSIGYITVDEDKRYPSWTRIR